MVDLSGLPLVPDEGYYWLWSRHLDWAYYDHPAGIALLLRLSTTLGGQSEFGLRWLNALLGTACVALIWAIGSGLTGMEEKGSSPRHTGRFTAWMVALGAPYLVISRFVYTDALFLFVMLLNFRFFLRMLAPRCAAAEFQNRPATDTVSFAAWGITLGLLFNTKYTAFLYIAALGFWLLLRRHSLLRDRRFWGAGALGTLGLLPMLGWNATRDWASFRWQIAHLLTTSPGAASRNLAWTWVRNVRHAVSYLTWPVAATALIGATLALAHRLRRRSSLGAEPSEAMVGLLEILALTLLTPVILSPSGSPRNLLGGLVFLFLRLGACGYTPSHRMSAVRTSLAALVTLYGVGTVAALRGVPTGLHSSVVHEIRRDVTGIREIAGSLSLPAEVTLFAIDYSLGGQLAYYTGRSVTTSWGQYRVWAQPDLSELTMVSLHYLAPDAIDRQLRRAYTIVDGPYSQTTGQEKEARQVYWWHARGLRWNHEEIVESFDFLALAEAHP
jgi:hypothetical protein